jgi:hypothetical protein
MNQAQSHIVQGNNFRWYRLSGSPGACVFLLTSALLLAAVMCAAQTTDQHKRRVPVIDKISGGPTEQAFSGAVKSLDVKGSVLEVTNARDGTDEYFPFKKSVRVSTADGKYATLDNVKLGWNVLIYYEEKDNGPSVKEIILLGPPKPAAEKTTAPPPPS